MACDIQNVLSNHKFDESSTFLKMNTEIVVSLKSASVFHLVSLLPPNCRTGGADFWGFFPVIYYLRRWEPPDSLHNLLFYSPSLNFLGYKTDESYLTAY